MSDPDQGNFLTGFTFGLFAGAMGYFLFGTEKGEELREQLSQEWESAKNDMAEAGVIDQSHTIRDVVNLVLNKINTEIEANQQSASSTKTHKNTPREKKSTKKFKGI
jgi:gas vesicle protein